MAEAAKVLGITVEAVRGRIKRDTLKHEKAADGTVFVLLKPDQSSTGRRPAADQPTDQSRPDAAPELVEELRDRVHYLERQVEEEREARRRADMLLAQLVQRVPELEPRREEPSESPQPRSDSPAPPEDLGTPGSGTARGAWWRRMFGG